MDRYPDFHYTHTQAYTYELLEKYYPELFEELKEKIAAGNFEPVGAMYIEPDCNIPSAESLIRQCLYGQMYFRSRFGKTVNNACCRMFWKQLDTAADLEKERSGVFCVK
mgnify:CR=1 FL=1